MNPAVEKLLEEQRALERRQQETEREKIILEMGLVEVKRIYSEDPNLSWSMADRLGFTQSELADGSLRFYREEKTPMALTDEEYAAIHEVWQKRKAAEAQSVPIPAPPEPEPFPTDFEGTAYPSEAPHDRSFGSIFFFIMAFLIWGFGLFSSFFNTITPVDTFDPLEFLAYIIVYFNYGSIPFATALILNNLEEIANQTRGTRFTFRKKK